MTSHRWLAAGSIAVVLSTACRGEEGPTTGDWSAASAIHGLMYVDATPSGKHLRLMVSPTRSELCSLFDGKHEALSLDYLTVTVHAHRTGTYAVAVGGEAEVALVKTVSGRKSSRAEATAGTVELTLADVAQRAELALDVALPENPVTELECNGAASVTGEYEASCECQRSDGSRFTCVQENSDVSCCMEEDQPTKPLTLKVESDYCPRMCSEVAGLGLCPRS